MRERAPMTQTITASQARQQWSQLLNRVFRRETRVLVEKSGVPVAAIIAADDLARLQELEAERDRDFAIIEEMRAAFKDVPDAELARQVTRAVTRARQKRQATMPVAPPA